MKSAHRITFPVKITFSNLHALMTNMERAAIGKVRKISDAIAILEIIAIIVIFILKINGPLFWRGLLTNLMDISTYSLHAVFISIQSAF